MKRGLRLLNVTRSTILATDLAIAEGFWERGRGLLGRKELRPGEGLVISRCRSIHMWGMRFAIDVIFVDRAWRVVALKRGVRPWALTPPVWGAWATVELPQGTIERSMVSIGDQLEASK